MPVDFINFALVSCHFTRAQGDAVSFFLAVAVFRTLLLSYPIPMKPFLVTLGAISDYKKVLVA